VEKYILSIIGGRVRRKESNDMKPPMKWTVIFKRGKIEIECRDWVVKLITMKRYNKKGDRIIFSMDVKKRLIYEKIVTRLTK
jgi:hypothetical protein